MDRNQLNERFYLKVVEALVNSILAEPRLQHLNRVYLPDRDVIVESISKLRQLVFPGYFGNQGLTTRCNLPFRIGELVIELSDMLYEQVRCCLRYREQIPASPDSDDKQCENCDHEAALIVAEFFNRIPKIREILATDVQAAFESDPAALSTDETIFCYPGLYTIFVQRMAHEFYDLKVPLLPRIMTEQAHSQTGIDIPPWKRSSGSRSLLTTAPASLSAKPPKSAEM